MPKLICLIFCLAVVYPVLGEANEIGSDFDAPILSIGSNANEIFLSDDKGFGTRAIALWNVVPFQNIKKEIEIGVVAFHMNGIERIDFSANGGPITSVKIAKINKRTNVLEYSIRLQIENNQDQKVDLRAIAYPNMGEPRELKPLILYANGHGRYSGKTVFVTNKRQKSKGVGTKSKPFSSMSKALRKAGSGGRVILLDPGLYYLGGKAGIKNIKSWITIEGREGLDKNDIILGLKERKLVRLDVDKLKFKNLSLDVGSFIQIYPEITTFVWFDKVVWFDSKGWAGVHKGQKLNPVRTSKYIGGYFVTNSISKDSLYGYPDAKLVRNSHLERISGDALQGVQMVLNVTIDNMDGDVRDHHSDILQYFGDFDNVIVFGLRATNIRNVQNIFLGHYKSSFQNMAFVNIAIDNKKGNPPFSQLSSQQDHVLFYHLSIPNQDWIVRDDMPNEKQFKAKNVIIKNSILGSLKRGKHSWRGLPSGMLISNTHFVRGAMHGKFPTSGKLNFSELSSNKITYDRIRPSVVVGNASPIFIYRNENPPPKRNIFINKGAFLFKP
ncbi:MAG: hypothetical protein JKX94_05605 [Sneathiella sp.]|nr:hypothetical protein [Sneathiella sp.]